MSEHNRWLDWKIKKGLVHRGRSNNAPEPKGVIATALNVLYYKSKHAATKEPTFKQGVGGTLGMAGKTNDGEKE